LKIFSTFWVRIAINIEKLGDYAALCGYAGRWQAMAGFFFNYIKGGIKDCICIYNLVYYWQHNFFGNIRAKKKNVYTCRPIRSEVCPRFSDKTITAAVRRASKKTGKIILFYKDNEKDWNYNS